MYAIPLNNNVIYFDSSGFEHIPTEIKNLIGNKNIKKNIFGIQTYDSVMCGYHCIGFIDFMLKGKNLTDLTNLISSNDFKNNEDITLNYFMTNLKKWLNALKHLMYIQMISNSSG